MLGFISNSPAKIWREVCMFAKYVCLRSMYVCAKYVCGGWVEKECR